MSVAPALWGVAALSPNAPIYGSSGDDNYGGTDDADFFLLDQDGADSIWGGAGDDSFYFGATLGAGDSIDGGSGSNDMVILQGTCAVDMAGVALSGIEMIVLMPGSDTRFGASGNGVSAYDITADDADLAAGQTFTIQGNKLGANESLNFYGYNETDGSFRIIGGAGADSLYGGGGADMILGGPGSDQMNGLGGSDIFIYRSAADSTVTLPDLIDSLQPGDKFDLRLVDADITSSGDQAFTFIGTDEFHYVAGELRVLNNGISWSIQGDTNGDGFGDFVIGGIFGVVPLDASFFFL